jgi:hypothetical protein
MIFTGENRRTRRKACPSATLSTTNPTWIDLGANPGLCGKRPATNDLSHGTAQHEFRPGWPVWVSTFTWSSSLFSGRRLPLGDTLKSCLGSLCWNKLFVCTVHNCSSKISSFLLWSRIMYPAVRRNISFLQFEDCFCHIV